jgi:RNA polymerase sigma-B factor
MKRTHKTSSDSHNEVASKPIKRLELLADARTKKQTEFDVVVGDATGGRKPTRNSSEEQLWRNFLERDCPQSRNHLIEQHRSLTVLIASRFAQYGEPLDDLVQVATIGLIKAVDNFDAALGSRFESYAIVMMLGEIKHYLRDYRQTLRVPQRKQSLLRLAKCTAAKLQAGTGKAPTTVELAAHLGLREEDILIALESGIVENTVAIDQLIMGTDDSRSLMEILGQHDPEFAAILQRDAIDAALKILSRREQIVLRLRFFHGLNQTQTAVHLNVSQMHISRLERKALQRLRDWFAGNAAARDDLSM